MVVGISAKGAPVVVPYQLCLFPRPCFVPLMFVSKYVMLCTLTCALQGSSWHSARLQEKVPQEKHPGGPKRSGKYLKFYLVTTTGDRVLAATGEDLGDAHYQYTNAKHFTKYGPVNVKTRHDIQIWSVVGTARVGAWETSRARCWERSA